MAIQWSDTTTRTKRRDWFALLNMRWTAERFAYEAPEAPRDVLVQQTLQDLLAAFDLHDRAPDGRCVPLCAPNEDVVISIPGRQDTRVSPFGVILSRQDPPQWVKLVLEHAEDNRPIQWEVGCAGCGSHRLASRSTDEVARILLGKVDPKVYCPYPRPTKAGCVIV